MDVRCQPRPDQRCRARVPRRHSSRAARRPEQAQRVEIRSPWTHKSTRVARRQRPGPAATSALQPVAASSIHLARSICVARARSIHLYCRPPPQGTSQPGGKTNGSSDVLRRPRALPPPRSSISVVVHHHHGCQAFRRGRLQPALARRPGPSPQRAHPARRPRRVRVRVCGPDPTHSPCLRTRGLSAHPQPATATMPSTPARAAGRIPFRANDAERFQSRDTPVSKPPGPEPCPTPRASAGDAARPGDAAQLGRPLGSAFAILPTRPGWSNPARCHTSWRPICHSGPAAGGADSLGARALSICRRPAALEVPLLCGAQSERTMRCPWVHCAHAMVDATADPVSHVL
jgi:hypothetical protein